MRESQMGICALVLYISSQIKKVLRDSADGFRSAGLPMHDGSFRDDGALHRTSKPPPLESRLQMKARIFITTFTAQLFSAIVGNVLLFTHVTNLLCSDSLNTVLRYYLGDSGEGTNFVIHVRSELIFLSQWLRPIRLEKRRLSSTITTKS